MSMDLVVITGMSGSGKSIALGALEDAGYYCVDNLPPELLEPFLALEDRLRARKVAIAMDVRSGESLPQLPLLLHGLRDKGLSLRQIFLDANDHTLVRRFSETRRRHPLSTPGETDIQQALLQTIRRERELLADLRERSHVIDTSYLRPSQLLAMVKDLIAAPAAHLTLVFESFAFKRGITLDADYVFDVRMLPNPHYEPELKPLTGRDQPVIDFLARQPSRAADAGADRHLLAHLAARAGARPPQLRDGGDWLHRRAAPLGLPGRTTGSPMPMLSICSTVTVSPGPPNSSSNTKPWITSTGQKADALM
jgi:UPF0042 nucleotide-binding protein